ncbi:hypothetical protein B0H13DRAFT_1862311 [Mycena leptocephala]|nr:hypothetical protein B0H13DRAFT_1862311 [Mycena leptocephala]
MPRKPENTGEHSRWYWYETKRAQLVHRARVGAESIAIAACAMDWWAAWEWPLRPPALLVEGEYVVEVKSARGRRWGREDGAEVAVGAGQRWRPETPRPHALPLPHTLSNVATELRDRDAGRVAGPLAEMKKGRKLRMETKRDESPASVTAGHDLTRTRTARGRAQSRCGISSASGSRREGKAKEGEGRRRAWEEGGAVLNTGGQAKCKCRPRGRSHRARILGRGNERASGMTSRGMIQRWRRGSGSAGAAAQIHLRERSENKMPSNRGRWERGRTSHEESVVNEGRRTSRASRQRMSCGSGHSCRRVRSSIWARDEDEACIAAVEWHREIPGAAREVEDPTGAQLCNAASEKAKNQKAKRTHRPRYSISRGAPRWRFSGYRRTAPKERRCSVGHNETSRRLDTQEDPGMVLRSTRPDSGADTDPWTRLPGSFVRSSFSSSKANLRRKESLEKEIYGKRGQTLPLSPNHHADGSNPSRVSYGASSSFCGISTVPFHRSAPKSLKNRTENGGVILVGSVLARFLHPLIEKVKSPTICFCS